MELKLNKASKLYILISGTSILFITSLVFGLITILLRRDVFWGITFVCFVLSFILALPLKVYLFWKKIHTKWITLLNLIIILGTLYLLAFSLILLTKHNRSKAWKEYPVKYNYTQRLIA